MLTRDDAFTFVPGHRAPSPSYLTRPAGRMAPASEARPASPSRREPGRHGPGARGGGAFVDFGEVGSSAEGLDAEERAWIAAGWGDRCSVCGQQLSSHARGATPVRRVCEACHVASDAMGRLR